MFPKTTKFNAMFPHMGDIHAGVSGHVRWLYCFPQKHDSTISVKVEFGKGEGKVPLDNIAKRAEETSDSREGGIHKGCIETFCNYKIEAVGGCK